MRSFVSRRVRSDADAEDIVQKVFLQMHRTVASLREADRLDAWLYQVARNAIVDHYRSPARRREVPSGDALDMAPLLPAGLASGPPDTSALEQASACLRPMVDRLPELYRRAITLVELGGRSQVEAARMEGVSVSGMKARVQRGRSRLKDMLLECCAVALGATGGVLDCEPQARKDTDVGMCGAAPPGSIKGRCGTTSAEKRSSPAGARARRST
jgi:RNA polymerase sigma-70 factor (ECF subfamily)